MSLWIFTYGGRYFGPFKDKGGAESFLNQKGWKTKTGIEWFLGEELALIVEREELLPKESLPCHPSIQTEDSIAPFRYGILLNNHLYPFGPFDDPEEAVNFLKEEGFTQVTNTDFIFSPNGEFDAQFAKIVFFPDFIPPEKIKERMNKKDTKWGTNNSAEIIL